MPPATPPADRYDAFLALHRSGAPLLIPNPWDRGSARVLAGLGFQALATTSGGFAATVGVQDGAVTRQQALEHARNIASAVDVPVSADLENGFADDPEQVARTVTDASRTGLAGCSIEDYSGDRGVYDRTLAVERVAAAAQAAHAGTHRLVLTARAENYLRGNPDLDDTVERLDRYAAAGADVLYAPGLTRIEDISVLVQSLERPVNVLVLAGGPTVAELAEAGVARISVGSHFANVALAALVEAGQEFLAGDTGFFQRSAAGRDAIRRFLPADPDH
jgi:2-methylisocitrate lyase-like PEP mutase family enzyme